MKEKIRISIELTQSKKICKELTESKPNRVQSKIEIAASGLKESKGVCIRFQRNLHFAVNLWLELPDPHRAELQPQLETELHVNVEGAGKFLGVELCKLLSGQKHHRLPGEVGAEDGGGFVALVERRQPLGI